MGKTSLEAVAVRGMRNSVQFGFAETRDVVRKVERMKVVVVRGFQVEEMKRKGDILTAAELVSS